LVDAASVECGVGPDCRRNCGLESGVSEDVRVEANRLTHEAAVLARRGAVGRVLELAGQIDGLGLTVLAGAIRDRFTHEPVIRITESGGVLEVETPWKRDPEFVSAWRSIPGRRFDRDRNVNLIPASQRAAVWALLRRYFSKKYGIGPKGLFRVGGVA
jgi:hypothetical protein